MEYEKAYVYQPDEDRPVKRRRTELQGLQASWPLRKKAYQKAWAVQQDRIDARLHSINASTIAEIASFLDASLTAPENGRIATGLVMAGPNSALRTSLASQVALQGKSGIKRLFISLSSGAGSNLKNLLKTIISKATSRASDDDEDDELEPPSGRRKGAKLLSYDLQILSDYVLEHHVQQVIIAFEDTEAFDSDLLSELFELLGNWKDRLPLAFILNIATSIEFLQQRLSSGAVKALEGTLFDSAISTDEAEQVFDALTGSSPTLWLGPTLVSAALERQSDYIQSIDSLVDAARYAYMTHYYANAISVFLNPDVPFKLVSREHLEALRNLPSFRAHAKQMLEDNDTKQLRGLLESDRALFDFAKQSVVDGVNTLTELIHATEVIRNTQQCLPNTQVSSRSSLYVQALSGKLSGSTMIRTMLLIVRKSPSNTALDIVTTLRKMKLSDHIEAQLLEVEDALKELMADRESSTQPLRSEDDVKNSTLRTTVVAQKVELSKQKSTLSKQDAQYTAVVRQLSDTLDSYFAAKLVNPKDLVLNEVFMYDSRSPHREVFTPRPRHAIERALAAPHDYLDCACCAPEQGDEESTLAGTQPATALLYQLYLESGSLINANDLWQAFQAVVGDTQNEQRTMALFQRSLAETRYLGMVKTTRKRVDHVAKVAWRGL
jgi:origin recognition complex subunit 3